MPVERLCSACGVRKAEKNLLKCSRCRKEHLKDIKRLCGDCGENDAAPGRTICWNCKYKRHMIAHPEDIEKTNERRVANYKTNKNGHRTKRLMLAKIYRDTHLEKVREDSRAWRELYPERHSESNRQWRAENPERIKHNSQLYALLNPEKIRHNHRLRKARMRKATIGTITPKLWKERVEYFGQCCAYCLQPMDVITMDHMTPIVRDGLHDIDNVVPSCGACNSRKQNRNLLEWVLWLRGIRCAGIGNRRPVGGRPRKQAA